METRAYFLFGDLFGNLIVGVSSSIICGYLCSDWPFMIIGMIVAMFLGMIISTILTITILLKWFGAMEVMLPAMSTGMFSAMAIVMWPPGGTYTIISAIELGLFVGAIIFIITWIINAVIVGKAPV
tara:strand:+ start:4122 stop:4499 length:378 start_codon:yes stop_codon:yes gene_type:complete